MTNRNYVKTVVRFRQKQKEKKNFKSTELLQPCMQMNVAVYMYGEKNLSSSGKLEVVSLVGFFKLRSECVS